jgi:anti-sigma factor RsiW
MKTPSKIHKMLLLNQSGELSDKDRQHLAALQATDPSIRKQAQELETLRTAWQQATADTPLPSPSVLLHIRQTAARQGRARKDAPLLWFRWPAVGIAAAAAAMIAIGASLYLAPWAPKATQPSQIAETDPVDLQIEAALEAIDSSMLALLDVQPEDTEFLPGNDS